MIYLIVLCIIIYLGTGYGISATLLAKGHISNPPDVVFTIFMWLPTFILMMLIKLLSGIIYFPSMFINWTIKKFSH